MSPDEFVLLFLVIVGVPLVLGTVNSFHKRNLKFKERQLANMGNETAEKAAQYAAHNERLEQRVRVLERIVTDKGIDVAGQIEMLRDASEIKELS